MSFWKRAHAQLRCLAIGCNATVLEGGIYYRNRWGLDYCEPCGRRLFLVAPPELVENVPAEKLALPPSLARFDKKAMGDDLHKRIVDFRRKQSGDTA